MERACFASFSTLYNPKSPLVVIVDALNEVNDEDDIARMLKFLAPTQTLSRMKLRFLISNHATQIVREGLEGAGTNFVDFVLHDEAEIEVCLARHFLVLVQPPFK